MLKSPALVTPGVDSILRAGTVHGGWAMIVRDLAARYLAHVTRRGTYSTAESFAERKSTIDRFCARFGGEDIDGLRPADLTDWIEDQPGWKSSSTCRAKANIIQRMMNWAAKERRIKCNPFDGAEPFPEAERRPCLPDENLHELCAATALCFSHALRFLRAAGCRFSDMAKLTKPMIIRDQGIAILGEHKTRAKTKRAKIIPIPEEAMKIIDSVPGEGLIFKNSRGQPWTRRAFGSRLRRLKKKLGLLKDGIGSTHGIRHQWGTTCYLNSGDIKLTSIGLGHKSVAITEKFYVHVDGNIDLIRKAADFANRK